MPAAESAVKAIQTALSLDHEGEQASRLTEAIELTRSAFSTGDADSSWHVRSGVMKMARATRTLDETTVHDERIGRYSIAQIRAQEAWQRVIRESPISSSATSREQIAVCLDVLNQVIADAICGDSRDRWSEPKEVNELRRSTHEAIRGKFNRCQ
jgi:hypothetical protein